MLSEFGDVVSIPMGKEDDRIGAVVYQRPVELQTEFLTELNPLVRDVGEPSVVVRSGLEGKFSFDEMKHAFVVHEKRSV